MSLVQYVKFKSVIIKMVSSEFYLIKYPINKT